MIDSWIPTMPDGDVVTQSGKMVCECHPKNSRLIAASPDMLAALQACFRWSNDWPDDVIIQVQEAIAKATGATHDA